ncbi:ABC transporter integral membrane protein [Salmonella enterica subsp. enterica]|nr:ABC transporter integral membrane protein [Salmonella enterica subsp. enterica]
MATRRQPLIPGWLIPGLCAAALMITVSLAAFLALWLNAPSGAWSTIWRDSYLWHVVRFSFWQAFLSAVLSVVPAVFLARALYRRRFPGRLALLRLCAMTLILRYWLPCSVFLACMAVRAGWPRCGRCWGFSGHSPPTACRAFYWRTSFLTCQWRAVCCCNRWKAFPASSASSPPSSVCAAGIFSVLSNGRGCAAKFRPSRR